MKHGDIVDTYYKNDGTRCPICGERGIDWTDGSWLCGFRSQFKYGLIDGKVCVDNPCKNDYTLETSITIDKVEECDCSGHQLLHFGHKCYLRKK